MTACESCVVDASVGIKLVVEEEHADKARRLFLQMAESPNCIFYVPDLFYVECANVLWKYVKRFDYSRKDAQAHLESIHALDMVPIEADTIATAALAIALEYSISVYDACYVAVSAHTDTPLITADRRLMRQLRKTAYQIRYLGDLEL
jgi:predicted nucleic acid-binding protein